MKHLVMVIYPLTMIPLSCIAGDVHTSFDKQQTVLGVLIISIDQR